MKNKKVVVTGGAGFIGGHLVERLVKEKYQVVVIDNLSEGKLENLKSVKNRVEFYQKDIRILKDLQKIFKGADTIFHQAALRSVKRSVDNPLATNENNITGTLNVLMAARDQKVRRVIFASSSSLYGEQKVKKFSESLCPNPLSPYALSKLVGEKYGQQFFNLFGLETVSLRYFNVFGPRQDPMNEYAAVIPLFITQLMAGKQPVIHWDGKQSRDFTYIDNVVEANLLAMKAKRVAGEVLNVAEGKSTSINQLYQLIKLRLKSKIKPKRQPKREGDIRYTCGDGKKAKKLMNYQSTISFRRGLNITIDWFLKNVG